MGNYMSCGTSVPLIKSGPKVIFPTGEARRIDEPTNAAELMLETPNYFLVDAKSLLVGKRFSALNADEELEMGRVYLFFPMRRLNAVVTAADVASICSAAKRGSRVSPGGIGDDVDDGENNKNLGSDELFLLQHRLSMRCRSKKPSLETIVEESSAYVR